MFKMTIDNIIALSEIIVFVTRVLGIKKFLTVLEVFKNQTVLKKA